MILVDTNLLVYAYVNEVPQHEAALKWLDRQLNEVLQGWPALGCPSRFCALGQQSQDLQESGLRACRLATGHNLALGPFGLDPCADGSPCRHPWSSFVHQRIESQ